jgi:general secretion pathway protein K
MYLSQQRGAALVLALLIVALVSAIAVGMGSDYQIQLRRASNHQLLNQAKHYLLGGEQLAMLALRTDLEQDADIDGYSDVWAQQAQPYPVKGGWLYGQVSDLQGRFNLNSLLVGLTADGQQAVPYTEAQQRFVNLIQAFPQLPITRAEAIEITEAVIDWLDNNQDPTGFGGKEDSYYARENLSYRTADAPMASPSELRAVGGMSDQLWQLLEPHVSVWPSNPQTININTLSAPVLAALNPAEQPLDQEIARLWVEELQAQPVTDLSVFVQDARWASPLTQQGLALKSEFFRYDGQVKLGDSMMEMHSVLHRSSKEITVIRRALGGL